MYDYLVVGSGLYGATFAHEAHQHGKSVLVIDKRPNIAGNIYTEKVEGIGGTLSRMSENEYCGLIENVNKINNEVTTGKYAENALYLSIKML